MLLDRRRLRYAEFFDWYDGVLDSLFRITANGVNGLSLVSPAKLSTRFNYFAAVSRFFGDAMLGDLPDMDSAARALLERLTEHWAVTGECCIIGGPGGFRAVRPDYVHPVYDEYDRDTITRFLLVFPQRQVRNDTDFLNENSYAERARVIDYDVATGTATMSIREYRYGYVADSPRGEPVSVGPLVFIDTHDGVYAQMDGLIREIIVRLNVLQLSLNMTAYPLLQVDTDSISGGILSGGVSQEGINAAASEGLGLTVQPPFIGEEGARYVERSGTGLTESLEYVRMLLGQLGVISGVPDYIFGVQLGRPANETERVLFAGQAKVNRFRRDIESAYQLIGYPVKFSGEPFVTRSERLDSVLKQHDSSIITQNESRAALGYQPVRGGNQFTNAVKALMGRGGDSA